MYRWRNGMTLVELLVVIAIVGTLVALLLPAVQSARASARTTACKSQMRQIGIAVLRYCDMHEGRLPTFSHDATNEHGSWVYTLAPYVENVDSLRVCPGDPQSRERLAARSTSYVINEYLAADVPGAVRDLDHVDSTSRTMTFFEGSDRRSAAFQNEHVHSSNWFTPLNVARGWTAAAVERDLQLDRHAGSANYLFLDGHVATIPASQIYEWIQKGFNFALSQ